MSLGGISVMAWKSICVFNIHRCYAVGFEKFESPRETRRNLLPLHRRPIASIPGFTAHTPLNGLLPSLGTYTAFPPGQPATGESGTPPEFMATHEGGSSYCTFTKRG